MTMAIVWGGLPELRSGGQAEGALAMGAEKEEFLETIQVVVSTRGTTGAGESLRVIQFLDEQEKL